MKLAILILMITLTGCSTIQRMTNRDGMTAEERAEYRKNKIAEERRVEALKDSLAPGDSQEKVVEAWGSPDKKEFVNGAYIYHYENDDDPINFWIVDNKVLQWQYDRQEEAQIRADKRSDKSRAVAAENARKSGIGSFLSALGGHKSTNCTTSTVGGTAYTNCH